MFAFLWLLLTSGAFGTSYTTAEWDTFLKSIDANLPLLAAADSRICYYLDITTTCSGQVIGTLLGQATVEPLTWTPTAANCLTLLQEQLFYLETLALDLFGAAITSAAAAGLTNFELVAQSWVLRAGHHSLKTDQVGFKDAINSITDWTKVHCENGALIYGILDTLTNELVGPAECDILDTAYVPPVDCTNPACSLADRDACCVLNGNSRCCTGY